MNPSRANHSAPCDAQFENPAVHPMRCQVLTKAQIQQGVSHVSSTRHKSREMSTLIETTQHISHSRLVSWVIPHLPTNFTTRSMVHGASIWGGFLNWGWVITLMTPAIVNGKSHCLSHFFGNIRFIQAQPIRFRVTWSRRCSVATWPRAQRYWSCHRRACASVPSWRRCCKMI